MSVRVVARIRPLLDKELDKDVIVRADSTEDGKQASIVKIPNPKNGAEEFSFAFNSVYDRPTTQEQLFTAEGKLLSLSLTPDGHRTPTGRLSLGDPRRVRIVPSVDAFLSNPCLLVAPHLKSLFQGLDVTIFAYGVTGTGKTHTMRGGLKLADRGVIPRLLSGVFRRSKKITKDSGGETQIKVDLSYYEIYNDKVFDLLEPIEKRQPSGLRLCEKDNKTYVVGLTERPCDDLRDFERLYIEANNNRITAATKLNAHSSRSHAILRVKLTQITGGMIRESTASAIDLAGSEDNRRTENNRERLVESAAINKSLFVLSQCVDAISRGDKRIPYRESKMTRILYHLDTLSSLNVSSRAKRIEVREIENEVVFKQMPRATSILSSAGAQRQPLRPLANAHNVHSGAAVAKAADPNKPAKAFNVYADRAKPSLVARPLANTAQVRRSNSTKRQSEVALSIPRPTASRISRPPLAPSQPNPSSITEADIEAMVEKKVSEILASRAAAQTSAPAPLPVQPEINEVMQRRLEALERRIEEEDRREDGRSDGLRYLLAARQHKDRGEDAAALRMYEMALPFFPGQAKLMGKIERLRAKLGIDHEDPENASVSSDRKRRRRAEDDDFEAAEDDDSLVDYASPRPKSRKKKVVKVTVMEDEKEEDGPVTPRAQRLLDIINSRDLMQIKSLTGFGPKKARDLVDYLEFLPEQSASHISSLGQLRAVPGMGGKMVERAYEGLGVAL
ncbi:unnamed protein product [Parascedosporium putredinis]|uniref:Kinesin motor domain-containing protein n=1 Tax=Parascedosporium putredinis TaxID=1442378 RepID=A0A9P1H304_9PEZI|nr:unnamed protein product [Parascedosporium putredinis]CAI7994735.1 unnamed protein product [Parascedosporium putredinis]